MTAEGAVLGGLAQLVGVCVHALQQQSNNKPVPLNSSVALCKPAEPFADSSEEQYLGV